MQAERKEVQYFKERKEGYLESVQSDVQRRKEEEEEEAERMAKEQAERERKEAIANRREELKLSLPPEVKNGVKSKTIALRFGDGRSGQRRFASNTPFTTIFNWVDAIYEIERELVVLTTLNGKQTFSWDDDIVCNKTLDEAGLGRNTGFRVIEKKQEESTESDRKEKTEANDEETNTEKKHERKKRDKDS